MILVLTHDCTPADADRVVAALEASQWSVRRIHSGDRMLLALTDGPADCDPAQLEDMAGVERIVPIAPDEPPAAAPRPGPQTRSIALTDQAMMGASRVAVIAGPCSVESEAQLFAVADAVVAAGGVGLRGGAFKPRTNPYSFQGLGERALEILAAARDRTGLAIVTEVMATEQVDLVAAYADVLQIGTRNMHNFSLLSAAGAAGKPVLLKRGWSATLDEWLHAAEYVLQAGGDQVMLCERGIRTFEDYVRNTLALAAIPAVKSRSSWPVVIDPSQGTGHAAYVPAMCKAAVAAGADGLLIEVHPEPARALTDGSQSLDLEQFGALMNALKPVAAAVGRTL